MPSSIVYSRSACNLSTSSRTSMHRALAVNRIDKRRVLQSRSLWWWGRHGTWSSANEHDNVEERLRRQQKIMSYRYSRALRRRATWDRDNSPPTWLWRGPARMVGRRWGCKPLSTSEHMQAKLKEQESGIPRQDKPWEEFHRDFESFKAAVDKAIEKDPYGYLFGRRLRGSSSENSPVWSPFARLFEQQEIKRQDVPEKGSIGSVTKIKIENLDKSKNVCKSDDVANASAKKSSNNTHTSKSDGAEDYVYDPISGRKVPKTQLETAESSQIWKPFPFLQTLFAEHGADEADKVNTTPKSGSTNTKVDEKLEKKIFENSRTREYLQLRAATIGTSIDTTAAFGGKYKPEAENEEEVPEKRTRTSAEHDENTPLYSGTVYEKLDTSRSSSRPEVVKTKSTWLQQEGFKQPPIQGPSPTEYSRTTRHDRLQPAFDRMITDLEQQPGTKYVAKLQPALDRMEAPKPAREVKAPRPAPLDVTGNPPAQKVQTEKVPFRSQNSPELDKREDLDLLRASDIRAATKTSRITRQEIDQANTEARSKLEADYTSRQKAAEASSDVDSARMTVRSSKTAASIDSVMRHMQRYPDGIVAKTMKSVGVFNDNFKKYQKPFGDSIDLTEKLELKPGALENLPSIYRSALGKARTIMAAKTSAEAMEIEKTKSETTEAVKTARQAIIDQQQKESKQIQNLAKELRQVYQAHTDQDGSSVSIQPTSMKAPTHESKDVIKRPIHPLQTATVKPGVQRYPDIERHTQQFEPKFIQVHEQLKVVSKNTAELSLAVATISNEKTSLKAFEKPAAISDAQHAQTPEKASVVASPEISKHNNVITQSGAQTRAIRPAQDEQDATKRTDKIKTHSTVAPKAAPALEKVPASPIASPYVLLTYNSNSKEVDITQLNNLMGAWEESSKVNPISVMSSLNHAAAFVMRFAELERIGYTLSGGGGDILIFRKQNIQVAPQKDNKEALESIKSIKSVIAEIRNRIASEEARSQPVSPSLTSKRMPEPAPVATHNSGPASKQVATVLDEIPVSMPEPAPLPPPTATPPVSPAKSNNKKKPKDSHKVRRQEQVFSGTIRPNAASNPNQTSSSGSTSDQPGFFTRLFRTMKRVTLTVGALGGVAYAIGVVSEGLGAHAQHQRAISSGTSDEGQGPRRKVVVTGATTPTTRPGFFSTESTRD